MSVYSGFATRQQETKYNQYVQTLITALLKRILKFYAGQLCDESKFRQLLNVLSERMARLQQGKFMPPKYSSLLFSAIYKLDCIGQRDEQFYDRGFRELDKPLLQADSLSAIKAPLQRDRSDIKSAFKSQLDRFRKKSYSISSVPHDVVPKKFKTVQTPPQKQYLAREQELMYNKKGRGNSCPDKSVAYGSSRMTKKQLIRAKEEYQLAKELLRMPKLESFFQTNTAQNSPREQIKRSILRRAPYTKKKNKMI